MTTRQGIAFVMHSLLGSALLAGVWLVNAASVIGDPLHTVGR